jgi:exopolysaccharide biosynthesis polyprenyl glycosylphosphotransferase
VGGEDAGPPPGGRSVRTDVPGAERRESPVYLLVKRVMDVGVAALMLLVFAPLFLVIAAAIKIDSPGPVFFRQTRIGKRGNPFSFFKFRSMIKDAERHKQSLKDLNEAEEPLFKIERDPRVTSVGRILRKTSLDELPQMINVLRGDMSLVGPRPHLPEEVECYGEWQKERLAVQPGITCLWQATNRKSTQFNEWIRSDVEYVRNRSLGMDLKILAKTVAIVLSLKEAS